MVAIVVARVVTIPKKMHQPVLSFLNFHVPLYTFMYVCSVCRPISCLRARKCYSVCAHRLFNWFPFGGHLGFLFQNFAAISIFIGVSL